VAVYRAFSLVLRPLWAGLAVAFSTLAALACLLLKAFENLE
jgi:hypothetical protein